MIPTVEVELSPPNAQDGADQRKKVRAPRVTRQDDRLRPLAEVDSRVPCCAPSVPPECHKRDRSGRSCIQVLANGWIGCSDLCPSCTTRFMAALDGLGEPLDWHPGFTSRALGGAR